MLPILKQFRKSDGHYLVLENDTTIPTDLKKLSSQRFNELNNLKNTGSLKTQKTPRKILLQLSIFDILLQMKNGITILF
jgi:hypothetical protein